MSVKRTLEVYAYGEATIERYSADTASVNVTLRDGSDEVEVEFDLSEAEDFRDLLTEVLNVTSEDEPEVYPNLDIPAIRTAAGAEAVVQSFVTVQRPMVIDYTKENGENVRRVVSPHNIQSIRDGSGLIPPRYVNGYDHTAGGPRNFRLARINGIAPASEDFTPKA
jgi:predicted DNA-binding transcriptional regulator YafY